MHPLPPPRRQPSEPPRDGVPGGNPWLLVWTIVGAKAATVVAILAFSWSMETGGFVLATQWHWLPLLGALVAAPAVFALRLRRVRARREALRRSEWMLDPAPLPGRARPGGGRHAVDTRRGRF
jgi:hypothetical protein